MGLNNRGYYFTLDAVLAIVLVAVVVSLALKPFVGSTELMPDEFLASDIVNTMAEMRVSEMQTPYVRALISNGSITLPGNSIAEQVGEFWSQGKDRQAVGLLNDFSNSYLRGVNMGVWIDSMRVFNTTGPSGGSVVAARRIVSGITYNRTRMGYMARAFARKAKKNNTLILMGDVIYSAVVNKKGNGNNQNNPDITYNFSLPRDAQIIDAYWFVQTFNRQKFEAFLNGVKVSGNQAVNDDSWFSVTPNVQPGKNLARIVYQFRATTGAAGEDGASHLVVKYKTDEVSTLQDLSRYDFARVISYCSIRYKKPIFATGAVSSMYVNLSLTAKNATLYFDFQGQTYTVSKKRVSGGKAFWSNAEILSTLQANGLSYSDLTGQYFWIILDVDTYSPFEDKGSMRAINEPSYVYVAMDLPGTIYGHIDITQPLNVSRYTTPLPNPNDVFFRHNEWWFSVSNFTTPLFVKSQLAYKHISGTPTQKVFVNQQTEYSSPPQPFIPYFARFGFNPIHIVNGTNNYTIDFGAGYGINPQKSLTAYTMLLKNFVPYGAVFDTEEEALKDAVNRLNASMKRYATIMEIESEAIGISSVPSLWGPMVFEVRVW